MALMIDRTLGESGDFAAHKVKCSTMSDTADQHGRAMSSDFRKKVNSTHKIVRLLANRPKILHEVGAIIEVFRRCNSVIREILNQSYPMVDLVEPERVPGGPINVRSIG